MLADFDPAVPAMAAQPFRLIGLDGWRVRRHVPGVLLADADGGVTVVDVKAPGRRSTLSRSYVIRWSQIQALNWANDERDESAFWLHAALRSEERRVGKEGRSRW